MRALIAGTLDGLRRAVGEPRLALTLWLLNLALAAVAGIPAWLRWRDVLDRAPETDPLRAGLRLGVLADLLQADRIGLGVLGPLVLAFLLFPVAARYRHRSNSLVATGRGLGHISAEPD